MPMTPTDDAWWDPNATCYTSSSVTAKINKLGWFQRSGREWHARVEGGYYAVWHMDKRWHLQATFAKCQNIGSGFATIEEAMQAAQQHFDSL